MFAIVSQISVLYARRRRLLVLILCLLGVVEGYATEAKEEIAMEAKREVKHIPNHRLLNAKQFTYLEKGCIISLRMLVPTHDKEVFESLMRIESTDKEVYNLIFSRSGKAGTELLWVSNSEVEKVQVDSAALFQGTVQSDTLAVKFSVFFPADSVSVAINGHRYAFSSRGIRSDRGYRFSVLGDRNAILRLLEGKSEVLSLGKEEKRLSAWYWVILIVVIDMAIFLGMHWRRKRQKRLEDNNRIEAINSLRKEGDTVLLPSSNAVYLFGGLQVFDANGEEISCRFSPLLRELFVLLLLRSAGNGISSDELTTTLWFDKEDSSAKNNRAVNLSKLRTLLESVGGCTISKVSGNWKLLFDKSALIDYYECLPEKIRPENLTTERIKVIAAMTAKGGLLNECDYLWLDSFKSRMADSLIESLLKYATLLDEHEAFDTKLLICDIIFRFDSVNEAALRLKCTTYMSMNRQYMAKTTYEHFCREYKSLYDEAFKLSFNNIISH